MRLEDRIGSACALLVVLAAPAAALGANDALTPTRAFREFNKKTAPELPESIVIDLLQDAEGRLWIATVGGLASYDGLALRAVRDPQAPAGGFIVLAPRAAGGLYASSRRGVHVFDGHGWRRLTTDQPIDSLAEMDGRWIWAVFGGRLWKLPADATAPAWQPVTLAPETGEARTIFSDRAGGVFVLGSRRYLHCRPEGCEPVANAIEAPERVSAAISTRSGALWVGTWDGRLQFVEPGASRWTTLDLGPWPSGGVRCLTEDRRGRIWAGGMARLCHGRAGEEWTCWGREAGLPNSAALALLADREGTLWLGLNGAGVLQWVGEAWSHRNAWPGDPLPSDGIDVTGVSATSDGGLLAAVFGKGILRWDGHRLETWGRRDGLDEDVRPVIEPAPGLVWAGARHGIFERGRDRRFHKTLALDSGFANGFAKSPDGDWYAWTDEYGIYRRVGDAWVPAEELNALLSDRSVNSLSWLSAGDLWIGASNSLVIRHRDGKVEALPLGLEHGLPESVASILELPDDQVWIGGTGGLAIRSGGRFRLLPEAEGVPGNVYFLKRGRDGAVWVGGSKGIVRHHAGRFTLYDATSGLLAHETNSGATLLPDGSLFAATGGSLAHFDAALASLPAPPLRVHWREPPGADHDPILRLGPDQRRLVLGWNAPWLSPEPVEYRTRVGRAAAWSSPTRTTQMTVENLAPGEWEIAVEARLMGSDDQAWTPPARLRAELAPHLWETAGAKAAALASLAGMLVLVVRLHARRLHRRREHALARLRTDFMASASHELRTPIAQIRLFADTLRFGRVRSEAERLEALDSIHRATQRLETLAGNLLQLARGQAYTPTFLPQRTSVLDLLQVAAKDAAALAAARNVSLRVEVAPTLYAHLDAEAMRQVVTNLLDNAIKYGPASQLVQIGAAMTSGGLRLWVEDQGPGIPPAESDKVWERFARLDRDRNSAVSGTGIGLAVVREIVTRAGGGTWIEDVAPAGTRIVVLLPQPAVETAASQAEPIREASR